MPEPQAQLNIDARTLREQGLVAGKRPEIPLEKKPLEIKGPDIHTAPKAPVKAMIVLGMGPVDPVFIGEKDHRYPTIGKSRMRHNAIAASELIANHCVEPGGLVVPTGTATADPIVVQQALDAITNVIPHHATPLTPIPREFGMSPQTVEEAELIYHETEANLMARLMTLAQPKSNSKDALAEVEMFPDHFATETVDNYVNALNELDRRQRENGQGLFRGSMIVVTSRYHTARTFEIARYLNLENQVVPIVSQEVLKKTGYDENNLYQAGGEEFDLETRWNEQKWIRTLHQMPAYFLPTLNTIHDDERLVETLTHVRGIYGDGVFAQYGLDNLQIGNVKTLRENLSKITRTNPKEEPWLRSDTAEVNHAIDEHVKFTNTWLEKNLTSTKQTQ